MQGESTHFFTERLDRLKFTLDLTDEQLANRIGLSRRMLYLMRTGKSAVSKKTVWKLEEVERATGVRPPDFPSSKSFPAGPSESGTQEIRKGKGKAELAKPSAQSAVSHAPGLASLRSDVATLRAALDRLEKRLAEMEGPQHV